jgi:phosphoglycolate phosphatase/putative hydrolase of the HAD superfamily
MRTYLSQIKALVFDIDNTLFRNDVYYNSLTSQLVEQYALEKKQSKEAARNLVSKLRDELGKNGMKASYTHVLSHLGISIQKQSQWKDELYRPEDFLFKDEKLIETLFILRKTCMLFTFTNNSTNIARKTLRVLGVEGFFTEIFSSESIGQPKPSAIPYKLISERFNLPLSSIVAIGDRYNVDLEPAIEMGCSGILVESMEDVYSLVNLF